MTKDKLTLSQLEQYLSKAAWILKGPVDASDFKVYIFPLLFFKRISDVYDEEYQNALKESEGDAEYASLPEFHRFILPKGCVSTPKMQTFESREIPLISKTMKKSRFTAVHVVHTLQ